MTCFNYYCRHCWELQHCSGLQHHAPIMRNTRAGGQVDRWDLGTTETGRETIVLFTRIRLQ